MKNTLQKIFRIFLVNASLLLAFAPAINVTSIPVTGNSAIFAAVPTTVQSVDDFAASVKNGNVNQITGVYAADKFALTVVQQPSGNAGYVSTASETVTQFGLASSYGSTGLLAHNYLAGKYFSSISSGATLTVIFGDGSKKNYTVSEVRQYQALDPTNLYSNFVNLSDSSKTLSSTDVFNETFGKSGALVLQTCITKDGNSSWGRLFIIAYAS
ncbi:MAG: hypothetical protein VB013_01725 [Anaerolineaceae bacterium]|nr:hypothetical protein [Anaerolineaceae bacterium]